MCLYFFYFRCNIFRGMASMTPIFEPRPDASAETTEHLADAEVAARKVLTRAIMVSVKRAARIINGEQIDFTDKRIQPLIEENGPLHVSPHSQYFRDIAANIDRLKEVAIIGRSALITDRATAEEFQIHSIEDLVFEPDDENASLRIKLNYLDSESGEIAQFDITGLGVTLDMELQ